MFTSRAEFRLHLRIDNADRRLTPHGRRVGLISDDAWADFQAKQERLAKMKKLLEKNADHCRNVWQQCHSEDAGARLRHRTGSCRSGARHRPDAGAIAEASRGHDRATSFRSCANWRRNFSPGKIRSESSVSPAAKLSSEVRNELKSVETEIKYEGYLLQQQRAMDRLKKSEQHSIPDWFDYRSVSGLSREMQEKLSNVQPRTIGQASRIPGVTPAAVSLVNVFIEIQARRREQAAAL